MTEEVTINRKLNLTLQWEVARGIIHIYSIPVSRVIFDDNYLLFARAYTSLYTNGLGAVAGPRISAKLIQQEAMELSKLDKYESLILEIRRLTNVFSPTANGGSYELLPYVEAIRRKIISDDDAAEIENAICFFTLVLWMMPKPRLKSMMEALSLIWPAQITSSTITEYQNSLPMLMMEEHIGQKQMQQANQVSSIPS